MSVSLIEDCNLRVSSVLNKNVKEYGKQYMIDRCDDTCWNSAQGSPQWVAIDFSKPASVEELHIQFQGGFAGKECWVEVKNNGEMKKLQSLYPEDKNSLQYVKDRKQIRILPKSTCRKKNMLRRNSNVTVTY